MNSKLYKGRLMHHRLQPKQHIFSYRVATWLFDLDELSQLDKSLKLFSRNRFNLFSFHDNDYGNQSNLSLKKQVNELLVNYKLEPADRVELLCCPRIFGYVFNPLSVYYCYRYESLMAIVYEVTSTFGERHFYVIEAEQDPNGKAVYQFVNKEIHVSPFFSRDCFYKFQAPGPDDHLWLNIELHHQSRERLFVAALSGTKQLISDRALLSSFLSIPFQTLKVIITIHWQALKLWIKGIPIVTHVSAEKPFSTTKGSLSPDDSKRLMEIE